MRLAGREDGVGGVDVDTSVVGWDGLQAEVWWIMGGEVTWLTPIYSMTGAETHFHVVERSEFIQFVRLAVWSAKLPA